MSIITYPLNGVVYSAEDVAIYLCTRTSGVYSKESNFAVSITGTRQITIAPGLAWINYDDFKGVAVCSREENILTVPDADNTLNRVDRVVLQFDTSENVTAIKLKTGTPAVAAQPPDILQNHNQYELGLCTISVPAGSSAVTIADITDTRADETVCGVMRDGVTGIPTAQLQAQIAALLAQLRQSITNVDKQGFYSKKEVDALLDALQEQVDSKISSATSIAASGTNYIRFTDGTQICWGEAGSALQGWPYYGNEYPINFAVPFINTSYAVAGLKASSISSSSNDDFYLTGKETTRARIKNPYPDTKDKLHSTFIIIGRWK